MSLKILWCLPHLPWPLVGGNKVRQFHLLRGLAEHGHRVTLLVQGKVLPDEETRARLTPLLDRLIVLERRPRKHPLTLAAALLAPYPVIVSVNGLSRRLRRTMAGLLQEQWDVVQVDHSYALQPVLGVLCDSQQPFALCEHNVESSLTGSTQYHPRIPAALVRQLRRYDGWRYRSWERRVLRAPARLIAVTPHDAERLTAISGRGVDVVANGVDARSLSTVHPDFASRRMLFVGNYEYAPNAAAVERIVTDILPLIWRRIPAVRFAVCGHGIPQTWRRRWQDPRIEWCGFVPDLSSEQRRSALLIAPLSEGGGSKLKVLESMAAGLPVVCTREGVSGLQVQDGREYREGCTAAELAASAMELLENEPLAHRMGEAGRAYVSLHHDWLSLVDQLVKIYRALPRRV